MLKKLLLLDSILLILIVFVGYQIRSETKRFDEQNDLNQIKAEASAKKVANRKNDPARLTERLTQLKERSKQLEAEIRESRRKYNLEKAAGEREALQKQIRNKITEVDQIRKQEEKLETELKQNTSLDQTTPIAAQGNGGAEYQVIVEKYLFSEERSMPKEQDGSVQPVPELTPKPVLTGIMLEGRTSLAIIEDPSTPPRPNGRKTTKVLRVGDEYRGYKVTQISANNLVLSFGNGKRTETIDLFDKSKPRPQGASGPTAMPTSPVPVTVRTVGQPPPAQPGIPATMPGSVPTSPPPPAAPPTGAPGVRPRPQVQPPAPQTNPPNPPPSRTGSPPRPSGVRTGTSSSMATPFGRIPKE